MTTLTRRQTTGLFLASATATLLPNVTTAGTAETLAKELGDALNERLLAGREGRFSVVQFALETDRDNKVVIRSLVRLDWPPGMRQRPFRSVGSSQQDAIVAMLGDCLDAFRDAWPRDGNDLSRTLKSS